MLNRLYIVVGVLAILALLAAFFVPPLVDWNAYRERLAVISSEILGRPVEIDGDVSFSLLPQPRLQFSGLRAGSPDAPRLAIDSVEAEFSLIDFIRDRYTITRLVLERPQLAIQIGSDGSVDAGIVLPATTMASTVSIANAQLRDAVVELSDSRSGESYRAEAVNGELRLETLSGPYVFSGSARVDGVDYQARLTTGAGAAGGPLPLSASVRPRDGQFALQLEGTLEAGLAPRFTGTMSWRQPPQRGEDASAAEAGRGDLVMTSEVVADTARVLLRNYVVIPDENRTQTRLSGAADVTLGMVPSFNAVISGGAIGLPPRDVSGERTAEPYELVRLFNELPIPRPPGLDGALGVDIAELDLRGFALRQVRIDAEATGGDWVVRHFSGQLPGGTQVALSGRVGMSRARPEFSGQASVTTPRLDTLATLWRKPAPGNPLFNMPGKIEARLDLVGETLSVSNGRLLLDQTTVPFTAQAGVGGNRDLRLSAALGQLDAQKSAALFAFLPDTLGDAAFAVTFPNGQFDLSADALTLDGLEGRGLVARGSWGGGVLVLDRLAATGLGDATFEAAFTAFGSLARPELSGRGSFRIAEATAPALARLYDLLAVPGFARHYLARSFPAALQFELGGPSEQGAQTLSLGGQLGSTELVALAELEAGLLRAPSGDLRVELDLRSNDPAAMTAQLGLGTTSLFPEDAPVHFAGVVSGNLDGSLAATLRVEGGGDSLGFAGNLAVTDPEHPTGRGTLKAKLGDPGGFMALAGLGGIDAPGFEGSATLEFDGLDRIVLGDVAGTSGGRRFAGALRLDRTAPAPQLTGALALDQLSLGEMVGQVAGGAALIAGEGLWPEGPLALGESSRGLAGRVTVTAPLLVAEGRELAEEVGFALDWDASATRLRGFTARVGEGSVTLDASLCCAGPLPDKQLSGRLTMAGVTLDTLLPEAAQGGIAGTLSGAARFESTGASLAGLAAAMSGEGTYSLEGLELSALDAAALATPPDVSEMLDADPAALAEEIETRLGAAPFIAGPVAGSFTIAGGTLRSANLAVPGGAGRLFGSGQLRLTDLGLTGSYTLTPRVEAASSRPAQAPVSAVVRVGGTLFAPERDYDLSQLVDGLMFAAYQAEVARLEAIQARDDVRRRAVGEAQAAIAAAAEQAAADAAAAAAAQAAREAEAEAARAAAEAARRAAAEAEAERAAAEEAVRREELRRLQEELSRPLDLGLGN